MEAKIKNGTLTDPKEIQEAYNSAWHQLDNLKYTNVIGPFGVAIPLGSKHIGDVEKKFGVDISEEVYRKHLQEVVNEQLGENVVVLTPPPHMWHEVFK